MRDIETTIAPERLNRDQREFFGAIDAIAQKRGLRSIPCAASVAEKTTCRSYETNTNVFLVGFLDLKAKKYVISVYEWNVGNRSPLSIELEAEVVENLRARFGERLVSIHRDGV